MKAVGTNTAHEHQRDRDDRTRHFLHRLAGRLDRRQPSSMCRSTFSTTTIASSTTMPIASTRPNSDSVLSEKPNAEHHGERADERHRHGDQRNDRGPPRLQEHHHDDDDQQDGFEQRFDDGADRLAHVDRRVVDDAVVDAVGKRLLERLHRRVGPGPRPRARSTPAAGRCRSPRRAGCRAGCAAHTCWSRARRGRRHGSA